MLEGRHDVLVRGLLTLSVNGDSACHRGGRSLRKPKQSGKKPPVPHGISQSEVWRARHGLKALLEVADRHRRRADLFAITSAPDRTAGWRTPIDNLTRNIGKRQRRAGLPAAMITVLEATPAPHAHIVALLPREHDPITCGDMDILVERVDKHDRLVGYLLKEVETQARHLVPGRKRGSHRLEGNGDRVRLSPELTAYAVERGHVVAYARKHAKRTTTRKPYTRRRPSAPVLRLVFQQELPLAIRPPARLADWAGHLMPPEVRIEVERRRDALGLTQDALAQRIGIRQPHLSNVLRGHDPLDDWRARRLRDVLLAPLAMNDDAAGLRVAA